MLFYDRIYELCDKSFHPLIRSLPAFLRKKGMSLHHKAILIPFSFIICASKTCSKVPAPSPASMQVVSDSSVSYDIIPRRSDPLPALFQSPGSPLWPGLKNALHRSRKRDWIRRQPGHLSGNTDNHSHPDSGLHQ